MKIKIHSSEEYVQYFIWLFNVHPTSSDHCHPSIYSRVFEYQIILERTGSVCSGPARFFLENNFTNMVKDRIHLILGTKVNLTYKDIEHCSISSRELKVQIILGFSHGNSIKRQNSKA